MKKYLIIIFVSIAALVPADRLNAQISILRSDADSLVLLGTNYIYNVQFEKAEETFRELINRYPKHPAGYFLDAMVEWWRMTIYLSSTNYDAIFLKKIDRVVDVCDAILDTNSKDINALFFKGGALGYRGRYYAVKKEWFPALSDGKEAFEILQLCHLLAPGNHDIMLGTGIYNYFAVAIPEEYPIVKPLMTFLPPGSKKVGLLQLKAAAQHARYAPIEAKVALLTTYYQFEHDFKEALRYAEELNISFPNNSYFHRYLARCYVRLGRMSDWEEEWREILKRRLAEKPGYDNTTAREALYYIGLALKRKGDYNTALKYFNKCDEACRSLDKEPSGFMIETNIHIGEIYLKQGKKDLARKQFNKILDWDDYKNSHSKASGLIKKL